MRIPTMILHCVMFAFDTGGLFSAGKLLIVSGDCRHGSVSIPHGSKKDGTIGASRTTEIMVPYSLDIYNGPQSDIGNYVGPCTLNSSFHFLFHYPYYPV